MNVFKVRDQRKAAGEFVFSLQETIAHIIGFGQMSKDHRVAIFQVNLLKFAPVAIVDVGRQMFSYLVEASKKIGLAVSSMLGAGSPCPPA